VACIAAGAVLFGQEEDTVMVWRATRDLSVGAVPSASGGDVVAVRVSAGVAQDRYAGPDVAGDSVDQVRLRLPIAAGELVPRSALASAPGRATRLVTVPVDPLHAPVGLMPGDAVDAWATPRSNAGADTLAEPALVLPGATVANVSVDALGIGGELAVVLEVPAEDAGRLVAAARGGVVDLVAVPITSQEATP
jgi:hypothetical protein